MNINCIVDIASREVSFQENYKIAAYDHNVDVIHFSVEPIEDFSLDLSSIKVAAQGPNKARHDYAVDPSTVAIEEETGYITFDWPIPAGVTEMPIGTFKYGDKGQLIFAVCAEIISGDTVSKAWHSDDGIITVVAHLEPESGGGEDPEEEATNAQKIGQLQTDVAVIRTEVGALANGSPTPVATVAEMTDESAVYLYTGSETGYTAGNWYYYNGTAWTSGGVYGGAVTDTTLSIRRAPADAKAVGDALTEIDTSVTAVEGDILELQNGGYVADQQKISEKINDWLEEHPEATTTVQNGAVTEVKLSDALRIKTVKDYVTPEMFGAKGDGVTDDTQAIQDAIDSNNLVYFSPKTYKCSRTITIGGEKRVCGNGTKIVSTASPAILLQNYYTDSQDHNAKPIYFDGFNLYGDDTNELIRVEKALKVSLLNVNFYDFLVGVNVVSGYELLAQNLRMLGSVADATGIIVASGDSTYKDIVMRDVHTGIDLRSGRNLLYNVHCWIRNPDYFENSVMVKDSTLGGANNILNDFYFDTYHYPILKIGPGFLLVNNPIVVVLKSVADNSGVTSGIFLSFDSENQEYGGKVAIYNYIAQIFNDTFYTLCNYQSIPFKFTLGTATYNTTSAFKNFNTSGIYTLASDTTKVAGDIRLKPDVIEFNMLINITNAHIGHYDDNVITFKNKIWFPTLIMYAKTYYDENTLGRDLEVDFISNGVRVRGYGKVYLTFSVPYEFIN